MQILKGKIYYKQTESWSGNDPKGTPVKVIRFFGPYNFIEYKKAKKIFGINFFCGESYYLNRLSFRRIFLGIDFIS
jgi:hypothetical protein